MLAATPLTLPLPQPQPLVANSGQALNTNERSKVETMIKRCAHSRAATRGELPPSTLLLLLLPLATGNWQLKDTTSVPLRVIRGEQSEIRRSCSSKFCLARKHTAASFCFFFLPFISFFVRPLLGDATGIQGRGSDYC